MAPEDKQFTFRLPPKLVARIDRCREQMHRSGLNINRTDVVRMLITRALDALPNCHLEELLPPDRPTPSEL
jgi:hypothetical protein